MRTIYNNVCLFITKDSCGAAAHQAQVTLPCGLDEDLYVEEGALRAFFIYDNTACGGGEDMSEAVT